MCSYVDLLLNKDFPQAASSSNSSSRQYSRTTKPNKSTKHCAIQKDSVQCTVAAVNISCLLFTNPFIEAVGNSGSNSRSSVFSFISCRGFYLYFSLFQLVIKPNSLLLEDHRSQRSSEGHNQKTILFIKLRVTKCLVPISVV